MLVFVLVAVAVATLFYYYNIKPMYYWKHRGVKQGRVVWFFGDNWGSVTRKHSFPEMVQILYNMFPATRYSGMYQFTLPTLVVRDPELIKQITVKEFNHFVDHRSIIPEDIDPLFSKNLFALTGQKWRDMRPLISPSFTSSKMKTMFVFMSECAENFVQHFLEQNQDLIEVEAKDIISRFTSDIIASTVYGVKVDSLKDRNNEFYVTGREATNFSSFRKMVVFFLNMCMPVFIIKMFNLTLFSKEIRNYYYNIVNETIKTREEKGIIRPDVIHLLMEARKGAQKYEEDTKVPDTGFATVEESSIGKGEANYTKITNEDIAAQAFIFFAGGFDATASHMSFLTYELAVNQDVQMKLREEIQHTIDQCNGKLKYDALMKMKYMDMVVSETLRKWPNAGFMDRKCTKSFTIDPVLPDEKPLHLEEGATILIPLFGIHRDPKYYPDPERFDPERFNDTNKEKIIPYTYLPFGSGPRNCIGSRFALLETKILIFHILSKFEIVPVKKTSIPLKLSKKSLNMNAENGFWCGLKRITL